MLQLTVTSFNGAPVAHLGASFDEMGGTIGRATTNQLVLPDPERVVSRVHAKVLFRGGSYALVACGGNALLVNERTVDHGTPVPLAPGDRIQMGGYCLSVGAPDAAAADPFASLFGDAATPARVPPAPAEAAQRAGADRGVRPLPPGSSGGHAIPEDWDPFERSRAEPRAALAGDPSAGAHGVVAATPREESLDQLFGLQPVAAGGSSGGGPFAPPPAANTAADTDPLRALQAPRRVAAAPLQDHVSDLSAPWDSIGALQDPLATPAAQGAVFSWRSLPGSALAPAAAGEPVPMQGPRAAGSAAGRALAEDGRAGGGDLLQALLDGLDTPDPGIERLTPELMRQIGQMLHESTRGTVELLAIRAALKRELRAGVTAINARDNNPLKFSPTVDAALRHLLGPPVAGFMPPVASVRDAFEDLRAHELAVMAGMKAALAGVLERFDPAVLEGRLASRSPLAGLIPAARKARLWDLFEELYRQLAEEAREDFDTLFGKAFLRAYEDYVQRVERGTPATGGRP